MTVFVIVAAAMLAIALALPLRPLLRQRAIPDITAGADPKRLKALDDALAAGVIDEVEYRTKRAGMQPMAGTPSTTSARRLAMCAAFAVALLLPVGAIVLYRLNGEPAALDPALRTATTAPSADEHGVDMDQAIAGLVAKLQSDPKNAEGWALLGRAYQSMGKFGESRDALKRAYDLMPDNHDLTVEYAQALALANEGRRISGEARQLIEGVLKADPDHQRALWLIGISDYQAADYDAAITAWNRLLPALPADSDIARSVRAQIAEAQALGGTVAITSAAPAPSAASPSPAAAAATTTPPASADGPRLTVQVSLDPALKSQLSPDAVLFVFARAENGPPMPLAIQRLPAGGLPQTVLLDDSMGMLPSMKLSMFPKLVIGARISKSGNATAQAGDLQVLASGIDVNRTEPIDLVINSVVP